MANRYDIDLSDGRTVTIESDVEPTEDEVLAAIQSQPKVEVAPPTNLGGLMQDWDRQSGLIPTVSAQSTLPTTFGVNLPPQEKSREQQVMEETWGQLSPTDKLLSDISKFGSEAVRGVGSTIKGLGLREQLGTPMLDDPNMMMSDWQMRQLDARMKETPEEQRQRITSDPAVQLGERIIGFGERQFPNVQPQSVSRPLGAVAGGVGSTLSFIPAGVAGPGALATVGALQAGATGYQEAIDSGADIDDATAAFAINALGGTTEALPIARVFDRINKASGGSVGRALKDMIASGFEESAQEAFQAVLGNAAAKNLYDEERELLDGVAQAAGTGGAVGFLLSGLGIGAGAATRRVGRTRQTVTPQEAPAATVDEAAINRGLEERTPDAVLTQGQEVPRTLQQPEVAQESAVEVPQAISSEEAVETLAPQVTPTPPVQDTHTKTDRVADEDLHVVVQSPGKLGDMDTPGYIQVDSMRGGKNEWSSNPNTLNAAGYKLPTTKMFLSLPQGKYKMPQALQMLKEKALNELVTAVKLKGKVFTDPNKGHIKIALDSGVEDAIQEVSKPENQGFVYNGDFISREDAATLLGEKLPLQSERLKELRAQRKKGGETSEETKEKEVEVLEPVAGAIATAPPLAPATTTPAKLQPKAQREIIADLSKGLNIPIRFGRLTTRKFAGYFKPVANLIGSKKAVDIPTVSHEVGHKLDQVFKLSSDASISSELDVLGDPSTLGSGSSWTPSKTKAYKMGEGVAEFVRYWLTDPPKALSMAPNTQRAWEAALANNKDFGDVMRQAQEDIQTWRNSEPQARLRSQIVSGNPNKTRYTGSQLIRDLVDDLHILRLASEHGAKTKPLDPSQNPYLLARNLRGSYGMADTFVRHGVTDFNTKGVTLGTSLSDALKPVAGRLSDFRDWIVAKRAQELISQGRETGLVKTDVDTVAARFDGDADFQKAFADIKAWNDSLLKYAVDSGLVTPESATAMRRLNQDYVPFHRVFEVGAGEAPSQQSTGTGMGLNVGKPGSLKGLKGSTRSIADPLETMVQNAYTLITASEKAAINRAVAEMSNLPDMGRWVERVAAPNEAVRVTVDKIRKELEASGADLTQVPDDLLLTFFRAGKTAPFGENTIRVIRDGKQEFYRLNRDLHDTFKALDLEDTGTLIRILAAPAQLLRSGVVLEPSFNIANLLRDTFSSAVISKYGSLPFQTTFKGVAAMLSKPQAIAEWAAAGGKNAVEAIYFDRDKLKKFLAERISKDLTPAERALIVTKSPLTALRYMTSVFEEATRVGEYQIALKKLTDSGMPIGEARRLAAFESRDRQDFAKGGAKTKIIRHMAAFWNAALQANAKLAQSFKQRPVRTTLQGLAFVTIPKLIEQAINWDDDDYWDRPQWERDMFFMIPIGKDETGHTRFLRLPTPFEVGVIFGTFPGRILQWMKQNRPDAMADFPKLMLKNSVPNPVPQAGQMIFEDFLSGKQGWDVYRGRTIVPDALKDLPPDLQYTDQTSRIAKEIGSRLNFSPMKVDHIIESTTGGIGKLATGRAQPFSRFVTRPLREVNQPTEDFYIKLEEMRMQAARTKLTGEGEIPDDLKAYERTARTLSELRRELRETDDKKEKAKLQQEMFELISETVKQ